MTSDLLARFGDKVKIDQTGCWIWQGRVYRDGYGEFVLPGHKRVAVHRLAWVLANGRAVERGKEICHRCDVRACCNPDHLFEGTHSENVRDAVTKRRHVSPSKGAFGGAAMAAKLTDAQAVQIRAAVASGARIADVAVQYQVGQTTVRDVASGRTFSHLPLSLLTGKRKRKNSPLLASGMRCPKCAAVKLLTDFSPSVAARGNGWCRECATEYARNR